MITESLIPVVAQNSCLRHERFSRPEEAGTERFIERGGNEEFGTDVQQGPWTVRGNLLLVPCVSLVCEVSVKPHFLILPNL